MRFDFRELRRTRKAKYFRLEDLARKTGLTTGTISNYENGKTEPTIAVLSRLAAALGIPPLNLIVNEESDWGNK